MTSLADVSPEEAGRYPGAAAPARTRRVDAHGVGIAVHEWGDEDAPPLLITHGGADFARTFDVFAPLLAAGGWRVVAWDHRGHGDSDHAALYSWDADLRDAFAVLRSTTDRPVPVLGHSKGGALLMGLAEAVPHRVKALVNLDGLPSRRKLPDVANRERVRLLAGDLEDWLDRRRAAAQADRRPGTIAELAARRARMNPRHDLRWLRYLVTVGARRYRDGWRWKLDPIIRGGGFGPWRPDWALWRMSSLPQPFFGVIGLVPEVMTSGNRPEEVREHLPRGGRLLVLDDVGHFVHIEQPDRIAAEVLDFLGPPS